MWVTHPTPRIAPETAIFVLRPGEKIALVYFAYTAVLCTVLHKGAAYQTAAAALPLMLWCGARAAGAGQRTLATEVAREWAIPALVLAGYLQLEWFRRPPDAALQVRFWNWDRQLLHTFGLGALIASGGAPLHGLLELSYTLLYTIPPFSLAGLYWLRLRPRVDRFLATFALGTFTAYALLPHFPTLGPREAFPGQDLPATTNIFRSFNLWLLDHFDITTSVFPSGHVAAAFSSAFGLIRAVPDFPRLCAAVLTAATLVFLATIYGRYHYAADGCASIVISLAAWRLLEAVDG
jgi:hypothetical protein